MLPLHIGLLRGANKAEAILAVAEVRADAEPEGNLRAVSVVVPRTTASTAAITERHTWAWRAAIYRSIPVPAPFTYVSAHVVKSVAVFLLCFYFPWSCSCEPRNVIYIVASCIFIAFSAACSPFPFCLCRQAEAVCFKVAGRSVPFAIEWIRYSSPAFRVGRTFYCIARS